MPVYTTGNRQITIADAAIDECPASLVDDEAMEWVNAYSRAQAMRELGAVPYSTNLSEWPALAVDAFLIIQTEHHKVRAAHAESFSPNHE